MTNFENASLAQLRAWCPGGASCESTLPPPPDGARWANCDLAGSSSMPACDLQPGERLVQDSGSPECRTAIATRATSAGTSTAVGAA